MQNWQKRKSKKGQQKATNEKACGGASGEKVEKERNEILNETSSLSNDEKEKKIRKGKRKQWKMHLEKNFETEFTIKMNQAAGSKILDKMDSCRKQYEQRKIMPAELSKQKSL